MNTPNHAPKRKPQPRPIYFTEAAKEIKLNQVKKALIEIGSKYPAATKYTFEYNWKRDDGSPIDILDETGGETFLNAVRHCVDWLTHFGFIETQRKTFYLRATAYGHKHRVETWINNVKNHGCGGEHIPYIPMLAFCVAAWILGIPERSEGGDNPIYPLSVRTLNHAEYSHQPDHLSRWSWARHKAAGRNAERLAELVQQRRKVDLRELETAADCSWWRALGFNERCAAVHEVRRQHAQRVAVCGDVGDKRGPLGKRKTSYVKPVF